MQKMPPVIFTGTLFGLLQSFGLAWGNIFNDDWFVRYCNLKSVYSEFQYNHPLEPLHTGMQQYMMQRTDRLLNGNAWRMCGGACMSKSASVSTLQVCNHPIIRSRPNQIMGPGPKSGPAGKLESRGPKNGVSRWRRPNSDIYSQNYHFGLVYDVIEQFLGMEAKNYKFGMFCQQCHPSVAPGDADIRPRNASRIHTCHLFTL